VITVIVPQAAAFVQSVSGPKARAGSGGRTLGDQVYAVLREMLISGVFQPGEKLSLRTLALRMKVSVQRCATRWHASSPTGR